MGRGLLVTRSSSEGRVRIPPEGSASTSSPGHDSRRRSASRRSRSGRRVGRGPSCSAHDPKSWRRRSSRSSWTPRPNRRWSGRCVDRGRRRGARQRSAARRTPARRRPARLPARRRPGCARRAPRSHPGGRSPGTAGHGAKHARLSGQPRAVRPRGRACPREVSGTLAQCGSGSTRTPGLSSPSGSTVALIRRIQSICSVDRPRCSWSTLSRPMPCSALMLPPSSATVWRTRPAVAASAPTSWMWRLPSRA